MKRSKVFKHFLSAKCISWIFGSRSEGCTSSGPWGAPGICWEPEDIGEKGVASQQRLRGPLRGPGSLAVGGRAAGSLTQGQPSTEVSFPIFSEDE